MTEKTAPLAQQQDQQAEHNDYKTERQWALAGMVLSDDAKGVQLRSSLKSNRSYVYYSPDEVVPGTKDQLDSYFQPERDRATILQRMRRQAKRQQEAAAQKILIQQDALQLRREIAAATLKRPDNDQPAHRDAIIIDTETTGLDPKTSELLQVAIIDVSGQVLFNRYFKPTAVEAWPAAMAVNGITPEMVEEAPPVWMYIREIQDILNSADEILGYNIWFDLDMLAAEGADHGDGQVIDVMKAFAMLFGQETPLGYKWQKLTTAAEYYGYDWTSAPGAAHNALADCYATLHVYKSILINEPVWCENRCWEIPAALMDEVQRGRAALAASVQTADDIQEQ